MRYQLQYKTYRRAFVRPVRLGAFHAEMREGILIQLTDAFGHQGYGEVAPLESFGSESVGKAESLLKTFCGVIQEASIWEIDRLEFPCLCYALECASGDIKRMGTAGVTDHSNPQTGGFVKSASLLQAADIDGFCNTRGEHCNAPVIKLKIGGDDRPICDAIARVKRVVSVCRSSLIKVRLDANEQLDVDQAELWLSALEEDADVIEYMEQPLDRWYFQELLELGRQSRIPIALDESLQVLQGQVDEPDGVEDFYFVVKPSLGDLNVVRRFHLPSDRVVISSVFETAVGFSHLLRLSPFLNVPGFDTQRSFEDHMGYPCSSQGYALDAPVSRNSVWQGLV